MDEYFFLSDLFGELQDIPPDSIISRTLFSADHLKVVLFGFAEGQELSEHTSAQSAVLHFLEGHARVVLGEDLHDAQPGSWIYMPPKLPHSIYAKTPVKMLLLLLKNQKL